MMSLDWQMHLWGKNKVQIFYQLHRGIIQVPLLDSFCYMQLLLSLLNTQSQRRQKHTLGNWMHHLHEFWWNTTASPVCLHFLVLHALHTFWQCTAFLLCSCVSLDWHTKVQLWQRETHDNCAIKIQVLFNSKCNHTVHFRVLKNSTHSPLLNFCQILLMTCFMTNW